MQKLSSLHRSMIDNNLMLVYTGNFTQEITTSLLTMTERRMKHSGDEGLLKRKIFNVMVECLQNISHHSEKPTHDKDNNSSIFTIGRDKDWYYISTGNLISSDKTEKLEGVLKKINSLSEEQLSTLYKDVIKKERSRRSDIGLGLVDIARKSKQKLLYEFSPVDKNYSFYSFSIRLKRNKKSS